MGRINAIKLIRDTVADLRARDEEGNSHLISSLYSDLNGQRVTVDFGLREAKQIADSIWDAATKEAWETRADPNVVHNYLLVESNVTSGKRKVELLAGMTHHEARQEAIIRVQTNGGRWHLVRCEAIVDTTVTVDEEG